MSFLRSSSRRFIFALILAGSSAIFSLAGEKPVPASPTAAILPRQFGGWQMQDAAKTGTDPTTADAANAGILKEYGFTDFASSTYTRDDGRTVKIRAARFADASGAVGAFLFYRQRDMQPEQIGDHAVSLGQRVLFYRGHVLVDALFSKESPMSSAQLRELAGLLPRPNGTAGNLPPVLSYVPNKGSVENTEKYANGPIALRALAPPIPVELVDFSASPEVTVRNYATSNGEATLMLIYYPTPQLAAEHLRRIEAAHGVSSPSGISDVQSVGPFFAKRTGPIVAIAAGALSESDAKALLGSVNYEASVTWNERTDSQEVRDLYKLILNIVILCAIVGGFAIIVGIAFGGVRILMKRFYPNKVFDRPEQMEFISLHLAEASAGEPSGRQNALMREGPKSSSGAS